MSGISGLGRAIKEACATADKAVETASAITMLKNLYQTRHLPLTEREEKAMWAYVDLTLQEHDRLVSEVSTLKKEIRNLENEALVRTRELLNEE